MCGYDEEGGKDGSYDDRASVSQANATNANVSANYAAAMAGLAGLYPGSQTSAAASAAFLNPAHYPAAYAAAQYNAALAAGYWPGAPTTNNASCSSGSVAGLDANSAACTSIAGNSGNTSGAQLQTSQNNHKPQA